MGNPETQNSQENYKPSTEPSKKGYRRVARNITRAELWRNFPKFLIPVPDVLP
jgi:hypothetical protein